MDYTSIRHLHIGCAGISIALFALRLLLSLRTVAWRQWKWLRIVPHVNDAILLTAAIALATLSHQYPWREPWLGAKVLLLLAYIGLGKMALRPDQPRTAQALWGSAALLTVFSIVAIALTRHATLFS
jgi:uncharacterized membrane protein SirB2